MKKYFILMLAIILLLGTVNAINSIEAKEKALNLVQGIEVLELKPIDSMIKTKKEFYFVPVILSNQKISLFIPINQKTGEMIKIKKDEEKKFEEVFQTTYFTRNIAALKEKGNLNITKEQISKLRLLKDNISNQVNKLLLIRNDESLNIKVINLIDEEVSLLSKMNASVDKIIKSMNSIIEKKNKMTEVEAVIDVIEKKELVNEYNSFQKQLNELQLLKSSYLKSRDKLKNAISKLEIDLTTKSNYVELISFLRASDIDTFKQKMELEINLVNELNSYNIPSTLFIELNNRIEANEVQKALNENDTELKNKTNYDSLKQAINDIIYYEIYWNEQNKVSKLKKNYNQLKDLIEKKNYSEAMKLINELKENTIKIIESGFKTAEKKEELPWLYYVGIALIIGFVLIIFFKNKEKIVSIIKRE